MAENKIPMDTRPEDEPRAVRLLKASIRELEYTAHHLEHDMIQWPHNEDYSFQIGIVKSLICNLRNKMEKERILR